MQKARAVDVVSLTMTKKIYKCTECNTIISIETEVHDLPASIVCPCDQVMPSIGA